jgi:uncharacterized protein (TIGR02996 family)
MTEDPTLLAAVLAAPHDDGPRLAYADWLAGREDEDDQLRAEFIRLQIKLVREPFAGAKAADPTAEIVRRTRWILDEARERELRERRASGWAVAVASLVHGYAFDRGFIGRVTLPAADFLVHGARLFGLAPILHVELTGVAGHVAELFASPLLERVPALSLRDAGLGDDDVEVLAASPHLAGLWWLDLGHNPIGRRGVEALAAAGERLPSLVYVGLDANPCDPRETVGLEGFLIVDVRLPADGKALEALHGHLPWLHHPTDSLLDYPPNPLRPRPPAQ